MHIYTYIFIYTYMCVRVPIYIYIYIHIHIPTSVRLFRHVFCSACMACMTCIQVRLCPAVKCHSPQRAKVARGVTRGIEYPLSAWAPRVFAYSAGGGLQEALEMGMEIRYFQC